MGSRCRERGGGLCRQRGCVALQGRALACALGRPETAHCLLRPALHHTPTAIQHLSHRCPPPAEEQHIASLERVPSCSDGKVSGPDPGYLRTGRIPLAGRTQAGMQRPGQHMTRGGMAYSDRVHRLYIRYWSWSGAAAGHLKARLRKQLLYTHRCNSAGPAPRMSSSIRDRR